MPQGLALLAVDFWQWSNDDPARGKREPMLARKGVPMEDIISGKGLDSPASAREEWQPCDKDGNPVSTG